MPEGDIVKVLCGECGGRERNHKILREFEIHRNNEDDHGSSKYQIVQCQGCETVRFRSDAWSTFDMNYETGEPDSTVHIYPEYQPGAREPVADAFDDIPSEVARIYQETIAALNAGTLILAGGGLRAIVEAICINAKARGRRLVDKIDGLVELNLLAKPQAELLHEERYIGNSALHEVEPPARKEIEDGLVIVESLLNTMYIAPASANRLRNSRLRKKAAKKVEVDAGGPEKKS